MINYSIQCKGVVNYGGLHNHQWDSLYDSRDSFTHPSPYTDDVFTVVKGHISKRCKNNNDDLSGKNIDIVKTEFSSKKGGKT
jgi:hypothetical protein